MKIMTNHHIILASESPRRKELFGKLGIPFDVQPSSVNEEVEGEHTPEEFALSIAKLKATAIGEKILIQLLFGRYNGSFRK